MKVRLRTLLTALLLVLSGGALTLLVEHLIVRPRAPAASPTVRHAALLAEMDTTLHLTPAQRDSIHAIFVRHQGLMDSAWRSIHQRLATTMDSVHHELEAVLQPDQLAAFRAWMGQQHGRHHPR
jgi:hypothetical protein